MSEPKAKLLPSQALNVLQHVSEQTRRRVERQHSDINQGHTAASSVTMCPAEVLQLFLKPLSSSDLHSCCLVSRNLRRVAEPLLYSGFRWEWLESRPPPIGLLLRSILQRPELATHIRNLALTGHTFYAPHFRGTVPKITSSEEELDLFIAAVQQTGVPFVNLWVRHLRLGTMDAFVALLVYLLSNVTSLHLGPNFTKETQLLGLVLRSALRESFNRQTFSHLRDVSVNMWVDTRRDQNVKNTEDMLAFFYLPDIRRLSASIENPDVFTWPLRELPNPAKLSSLDLTAIREVHLGQILSVTKGIETLSWEWYHNPALRDPFNTPIIDLTQIASALSTVQGTLRNLTITAACDTGWAEPEFPRLSITGSLAALRDFKTLRKLSVPLPLLLGFYPDPSRRLEHLLPQGLEHLTISDDLRLHEEYLWDDHALLRVVESWLQNRKIYAPKLQKLGLLLRETDDEWGPTERAELRSVCARVQVEADIVKLLDDL